MNTIDIIIKYYTERANDIPRHRYTFKKKIQLDITPIPDLSIIDLDVCITLRNLTYDVQQKCYYAYIETQTDLGYNHDDPFEASKDIVERYKKSGWSVVKIEED